MKLYRWDPWLSARRAPERLAVVAGRDSYTFAELVDRADRLGAGLARAGLVDGAIVRSDLPVGPRFFALALAALRYGYGFFPVSSGRPANQADRQLLAAVDVGLHVSAGEADGSVAFGDLLRSGGQSSPHPPGRPSRAGYLVFGTSGTTGDRKAVVRTRPWYPYRGVAVDPRYGAAIDRGPHVMAQPTFHLGTVGPALYALQAGSGVVVQPTWSPAKLVELIDRHEADSVFLTVDHLAEVAATRRWTRRRVVAVFHGGSPCTPSVKRAAIDLMGPVLHEIYGTSEGLISEISSAEWLSHPGSVGRPLPGIEVWTECDGVRLGDGETGELCVAPRPVDRRGTDDVIRTGDLGYRGPDGYLFLVGRVNARQSTEHALLEHAVRSIPGVTDAIVIATGGLSHAGTACLVEAWPEMLEAVRTRILTALAARASQPFTVDLRPAGMFPRSANGKLRYPPAGPSRPGEVGSS